MRQIKFRAKDSFGVWIFGIPKTSSTLHLTLDCIAQYFTEQRKYGRENVVVIPETLGQFTGLTDKNGVEIYEGDILFDYEIDNETGHDISGKFPVVYDISNCQFAIDNSFKKDGSSFVNFVEYFGIENLEVVGNIHDNPEMIFSF